MLLAKKNTTPCVTDSAVFFQVTSYFLNDTVWRDNTFSRLGSVMLRPVVNLEDP